MIFDKFKITKIKIQLTKYISTINAQNWSKVHVFTCAQKNVNI